MKDRREDKRGRGRKKSRSKWRVGDILGRIDGSCWDIYGLLFRVVFVREYQQPV